MNPLPSNFKLLPPEDQIILLLKSEPVIIDFGMATIFGDKPYGCTPNYCPPESFLKYELTPKFDIFSFGCLIYVMVSGGQHPFDTFKPENWNWSSEIPKPDYPLKKEPGRTQYTTQRLVFGTKNSISIQFQDLIRRMIDPIPEKRPEMKEIIEFLENEFNR